MNETKHTPTLLQRYRTEPALHARTGQLVAAIMQAISTRQSLYSDELADTLTEIFLPIADQLNQHDRLKADRDALLEAVKEIENRAKRIREDKALVGTEAFYIEQIARAAIAAAEKELP